tara:strand:- start:95 stop:361 length:267 start_codon:yes stop_codon:yes gene_type:complete
MKKITTLFVSVALGVSVLVGAEPKWKVGQEVMVMGVALVVVGFSDVTGAPLFKPKSLVEAQGMKLVVAVDTSSKSESGCTKIAGCPSE